MLNRIEEKHAGVKYTIFRSMEKIRASLEVSVQRVEVRYCRICGRITVNETCRPCQMLQELSIP
jgi:hypothetical protein